MTTATEYPARLIEVFSAIQGGTQRRYPQIFIRFPMIYAASFATATLGVRPLVEVERSPGLRDFETHSNPVSSPVTRMD